MTLAFNLQPIGANTAALPLPSAGTSDTPRESGMMISVAAGLEAIARVAWLAMTRSRGPADVAATDANDCDAEQSPYIHVVQDGETLCGIAERHGVSAYALMAANPQVLATTRLEGGLRLKLPCAGFGSAP